MASGQAEAERQLSTLNAEVDRLTKRRDSIVAQLGALRDVVAGFADVPDPKQAQGTAGKVEAKADGKAAGKADEKAGAKVEAKADTKAEAASKSKAEDDDE